MSAPKVTAEDLVEQEIDLADLQVQALGAKAERPPIQIDEDGDHGGERFTDHVNAVHAAEQARRALRHADEMGEKWLHVGKKKWALDFRGVVKPYAQKVAQAYYMESERVRENKTKRVRAEMRAREKAKQTTTEDDE
jgi:hypothetical protein